MHEFKDTFTISKTRNSIVIKDQVTFKNKVLAALTEGGALEARSQFLFAKQVSNSTDILIQVRVLPTSQVA